ncbi:Uncharacterised protein [Bordetella pertussis]|nr:Uncharacterised protein [Bordetella pertussis]
MRAYSVENMPRIMGTRCGTNVSPTLPPASFSSWATISG